MQIGGFYSVFIETTLTLISTIVLVFTLFNIFGVIRTLEYRAKTISSNTDILDKELNHIKCAPSVPKEYRTSSRVGRT